MSLQSFVSLSPLLPDSPFFPKVPTNYQTGKPAMKPSLAAFVVLITASAAYALPVEEQDSRYVRFDFARVGESLAFNDQSLMFQLDTTWDGRGVGNQSLTARDFSRVRRHKRGSEIQFIYTSAPAAWGGPITVTVAFKRLSREIEAQLFLENRSNRAIECVRFPLIDVQPVADDDKLLLSHSMGDLLHDPVDVVTRRFGRPGGGGELNYRYPAILAMQYMVLFNESRSLYLSAYSTGDESFSHNVYTLDDDGLRLSCNWYPFLKSGKWQTPLCGFTLLDGGWHTSADLYRSRMARHFQPPPLPDWMRESFHGWLQTSLKGGEEKTIWKYRDLPDFYSNTVAPLGLNVLHVFSWARGGMDNDYPLHYPSPYLGTEEELIAANDEIRRRGGRMVLYTNGRLVEPGTPFFDEMGGDKACAIDANGERYPEQYTRLFYVACPLSPIYQWAMFDNFERMTKQYRAHAAQIDQVNCTPANFCYDASHGHPTPATNFLPGYDAMLSRIHRIYRAANPEFFVWVEGCHERFGRYFEVHQSHGEEGTWTAGESLPEQFIYTFPNLLTTGTCDSIEQLSHTYCEGKPFDFHIRRLMDTPGWPELFKKLVAARKSEPEYFLGGKFTDSVGLTVAPDTLRVFGIERRKHKGLLVNVWSKATDLDAAAQATLANPQPKWKYRAVYPADLRVTAGEGESLNLAWTGPVATVVFER